MKQVKEQTLVASIRCDVRDVEIIASYLVKRDVILGTKSKIASRAIRILADILIGDGEKKSTQDALASLVEMGYGRKKNKLAKDPMAKRIFEDQCLADALKQIREYS